jgi:RimJ/RimL family protein N-acetyltransferase
MRPEIGPILFEPVTADHYALLRDWLERPHMREWWGDPEEELGYIRDMVAGRDTTRPFLIMLGGEPIGSIQNWYIGDHRNEAWLKDHPWLAEFPASSVGVDISIGEAERLSQGIGSAALNAFVRRLLDEGRETVVIDPGPDNHRAIRAYRKAGFRPVPHLEGRTEGVLIMQYDKNHETST